MTRGRALLLVLAVALAIRLANLAWMSGQPIADYQTRWAESDMQANWEWSARILRGDVLGRDTFHPFPSWMQEIAPLETWERWWGGAHVFYKAPLYAYVLAGIRSVAGDSFWGVGLGQMTLGLANVALTFLLAARLFGISVGTLAGLGAALYGPALLHEPLLLRDVLGVTVSLLLLWWLARCTGPRPGAWLVAGVLFATALLAREVTMLYAPALALWLVQRWWRRWRALGVVAGAFAAGVALGLAPLVARNVAVGAPPLALSALGTEALVYGHAAGTTPFDFTIPPESGAILRAADGNRMAALRLTVASYRGDWSALAHAEAERSAAIFAAYEPADNVSWYYFADRSPILRFALRWDVVLALGLVGAWLAGRAARADQRFLLYFLATALAALQYAPVVGRYRLVPAAVLIVYAAVTLDRVGRSLLARRPGPALAVAATAVLLALASRTLLATRAAPMRYRAAEFVLAAQVHTRHGDLDGAYREARAGLEHAWAGPEQQVLPEGYLRLAQGLVEVAGRTGREDDAAALLDRLAAVYGRDPNLPELLRVLRREPPTPSR